MALAEILQEIKTVKPYVDEDVDSGPVETLAGRRGRKMQSIERFKQLKTAYVNELRKTSLFIIVTGTGRDAFSKIATEELGLFSADPEKIYRDLANRIPKELYMGRETLANLFEVLGRHLEDKATELDIIGYPMLRFQDKFRTTIHNTEDFVSLVKRSVNDMIGAEIAGIQSVRTVADTAIERDHSAKTTSIVLSTADEVLVTELMRDLGRLSPRVFLVVAGKTSKAIRGIDGALSVKEPTGDSVAGVLKEIKNSIRR